MTVTRKSKTMSFPSKRSKYGARTIIADGHKFDSKREYERYQVLRAMERNGEIMDLRTQVTYTLIPSQYIGRKCVERPLKYIADFTYVHGGETVCEDVKGYRTDVYRIKRKLMLYIHGIRVHEV